MGNGYSRKPGGGTLVQQAQQPAMIPTPGKHTAVQGQSQPAPAAPGKQTLAAGQLYSAKSPLAVETGSAYVDQGLACETGAGPECVLTPEQRMRLVPTYQARVTAAQQQYIAALIELRVEELLKKEPEQSEWIMELMLDIISDLTISTVMKAFKLLKGGATDAIEHAIADSNALSHAMHEESGEHLHESIAMLVGVGKKQAGKALEHKEDPSKPEVGTQKAANVAFLDYLKDQSATIYENLREGAIAGASDSAFLVLFAAFRAAEHTVSIYKEAIESKLKRFEKSSVGKLGVTRNEEAYGVDAIIGMGGPAEWDTKAWWVKTPTGRRLALYRRAYREISDTVAEPFSPRHMASPIEKNMMIVEDAKRPYTFVRYVPDEFVGAAIAMHTAKWQHEPFERVAQTPEEITFAEVPS